MSPVAVPFNRTGVVGKRQSTFWELDIQDAGLWRVHFKGKREYSFDEPGRFESFCVFDSHPLLADYQDPWDSVYLAGPVGCPVDVVNRLYKAVAMETNEWRSASRYLNDSVDLCEMLESGFGMLFRAPKRIGRSMAQVLFEAGARSTNLPYGVKCTEGVVLVMGRSFVVANDFEYERLSGAC